MELIQPEMMTAEGGTTPPTEGDTDGFTVKYNKEHVTLSREDAIRYAQMGMKYDTVRPMLDTLHAVAAREGKTLTAYVEGLAEGATPSVTACAVPPPPKEEAIPSVACGDDSTAIADRLAEDYLTLCREIPTVGAFDALPPAVLSEAAESGISLLDAYLRYEHRERARIAADTAAAAAAAEHSLGSQAAGASPDITAAERAMLRGVWG